MAYIDEGSVVALTEGASIDILITHQGPATTQGPHRGAESLDLVLAAGRVRTWFHGHSVGDDTIRRVGETMVVPLNGVPFKPVRGAHGAPPGADAWCAVGFDGKTVEVQRERPDCWVEFHRSAWRELPGGQLVAPPVARWFSGGCGFATGSESAHRPIHSARLRQHAEDN